MTNTHDHQSPTDTSKPDLGKAARDAVGDLKKKAGELGETVAQTAKDQAAGFGSAASDFASKAQEKVEEEIGHKKSIGADYLASIAKAMDRAAGEFDADVPQAARYIRRASDQINGFADTVRDRTARELVGEVQEFARKQPTLFFGGALMAGFAALRFLKSASPATSTSDSDRRQTS